MVFAWPGPDGLTTRFVYDTGLFTEPTMTRLAAGYEQLLRAAADGPDTPLSDLLPRS
jgi:hypothetical protein